jgi:cell division protein FtsW
VTPAAGASPVGAEGWRRPRLKVVAGEGTRRRRRPGPVGRREILSTKTALLVVIGSLCGIGLVMVLSASAYTSLVEDGSVWTIFSRQVLWMTLGGIALYGTARMSYEKWRRVRVVLLVGTLLLLTAVLVPGIGVSAGGSARWLGFGQLRLQPSELMKLALAVFAADLLARRADRVREPGAVVVPLLVVLGIAGILVLKQPDMGTALVLACITLSMLYAGGVPLRPVLKVLAGVAVLGVALGLAEPYRRARLLSFVNPFAHAQGSGYQVVQSLVGLGSGRLFGLGLAAGREKWGLLPNAHTDFIFSVIGEQVGLFGALIVLGLFGALAWYGLKAAGRAPDRFGALMAVAATCWITSQAVINIGAVIGLLPVTGIPLPFISFGGSSLVITMMAAGILVNVAAHEKLPLSAVPRAPTPRSPRSPSPRSASPRSASPRSASPRSASPRSASPRSQSPRSPGR